MVRRYSEDLSSAKGHEPDGQSRVVTKPAKRNSCRCYIHSANVENGCWVNKVSADADPIPGRCSAVDGNLCIRTRSSDFLFFCFIRDASSTFIGNGRNIIKIMNSSLTMTAKK